MAGINSWLKPVTGKLKELASDIVTVRTGTVVSDFASMTQTVVVLDNDPDSAQVQALCLWKPLPAQTRVQMLAYPPRGLVIYGPMTEYTDPDITAIQAELLAAFPVGIGAWTDWTPTITQSVSVTRTITRAKYFKVGRMVTIMADLTVTSSGTAANSVVIGGLPFTAAYASFQRIGTAGIFDASAGDNLTGITLFNGTNNTFAFLSTRANGFLGAVAVANGDNISFSGTYEASS